MGLMAKSKNYPSHTKTKLSEIDVMQSNLKKNFQN